MKITEETKIKELIPHGYEFDEINECTNGIQVFFKLNQQKKEEKTFEQYFNEYYNTNLRYYNELLMMEVSTNFRMQKWNLIPREINFGLFSVICHDLGSFIVELHYYFINKEFSKPVQDICPKDFLNSIFE